MPVLIDRDDAIKAIDDACYYGSSADANHAEENIMELSTFEYEYAPIATTRLVSTEYAPLIHARWITTVTKIEWWSTVSVRCSSCDWNTSHHVTHNYCPNCGAKMDLDGNTNGV